jgi:hypothetical protein
MSPTVELRVGACTLPKARSVTRLFWYYFEVLFCGGSSNSILKRAFVTETKHLLEYDTIFCEVLTRCGHM